MNKYLSEKIVGVVIIIDNGITSSLDYLLSQYGDLKEYVKIIPASDVAPKESFRKGGWWSQQILKLLIAYKVKSEKYVALDAKNHMVFPLEEKFLERWGKPKAFRKDYTKHPSIRWLNNSLKYFNLPPDEHVKAFMQTTTPFVFVTHLVKQLIKYVENRDKTAFSKAFFKHDLTEFWLYAAFLIHTNQMCYDFSMTECQCVWEFIHNDNYVESIIRSTEHDKIPFFSVHRRAVPCISDNARWMIIDFWTRRGLDGSTLLAPSTSQRRLTLHFTSIPGTIKRFTRIIGGWRTTLVWPCRKN